MIRICLFTLCSVILISAFLLRILSDNDTASTWIPNLENRVAKDLDNWTWKDVPLDESEEVRNRIDRVLNYDDYVYRRYQSTKNEGVIVYVWAAYWSQGSLDVLSVHDHIPDNCWVDAGWSMTEKDDQYVLGFQQQQNIIAGQYRLMVRPEGEAHVLYWHMVNGKSFKTRHGQDLTKEFSPMLDLIESGFKGDQYFLRLASNRPFDELILDDGFREIVDSIARYGLHSPVAYR